MLRLLTLPLLFQFVFMQQPPTQYIISLKEGHSPAAVTSLVDRLVAQGAVVKDKFEIIQAVSIDVPRNTQSMSILSDPALLQDVDVELDQEVHILNDKPETAEAVAATNKHIWDEVQKDPEAAVGTLPPAMQQAGFGP
jgi:hypothetical protein